MPVSTPAVRRLAAALALAALAAPGLAQPPEEGPAAGSAPPLVAPLSDGVTLDLPAVDPAVPSPAAFLGYPLGERFTHHHRALAYLERLAEASPRVALWQYGESYEGRPLTLLAIGSEANVARLEEVRREHLALLGAAGAGGEALAADERERRLAEAPVVVWLAYGVHGNESSSAEAALGAAYLLAAAEGPEWRALRDDALVLIDPLVNPDGRERYVSGYEQKRGLRPDPDPDAAEHWEEWPGGRQNHYLIDLNRDWAWASQRETRHRLAEYRRWEPQVFVDYHEMFPESSYFFPPAADPVHPSIDPRTVAWLDVFGRGNAAAFDRYGWPYFKGEVFDLFYPGYGDSYPGLRGAVGMTYEMAGHGRAGLAYERRDGSLLTLADRVARHLETSLATVRTAAGERRGLLEQMAAAIAAASGRSGPHYFWPGNAPEAVALAGLLAEHGIEVGRLDAATEVAVRPHGAVGAAAGRATPRRLPAGTFVVGAGQPLGNLVRALLDPAPEIDPAFLERQRERLEQNVFTEFYDITSWSLPLAFNLEAWIADEVPRGFEERRRTWTPTDSGGIEATGAEGRLGYLVPPAGLAGYRLASRLLDAEVAFRVALAGFDLGGTSYPAGTLYVPRRGNPDDLAALLERLGRTTGVRAVPIDEAYTSAGTSLGSDRVPTVVPPKVGLISGEGVSPTSFGFLWHLLDRQVELPHHRLDLGTLGRVDLADYDVLVLPDGWGYGAELGGGTGDALAAWVRGGGILVAVGGAHDWLVDKELTSIETWQPEDGESNGRGGRASEGEREDATAAFLAGQPVATPGAILATELARHPLTAGIPSPPPALVTGSRVLLATGDPQRDLLTAVDEDPVIAGVAWPEAVERLAGSLLVGIERQGRGTVVVFAEEPDFRLFWRGTAPLFLNAVIYGPSI